LLLTIVVWEARVVGEGRCVGTMSGSMSKAPYSIFFLDLTSKHLQKLSSRRKEFKSGLISKRSFHKE
jgi:hypothetical protein